MEYSDNCNLFYTIQKFDWNTGDKLKHEDPRDYGLDQIIFPFVSEKDKLEITATTPRGGYYSMCYLNATNGFGKIIGTAYYVTGQTIFI